MDTNISEQLKRVTKWDIDKFERKGNDFDFSEVAPRVRKIYELLSAARSCEDFFANMSSTRRQLITNLLQNLINAIDQMGSYNPRETSNPNGVRGEIVRQIDESYDKLEQPFFLPLELFLLNKYSSIQDLENLKAKAKDTANEIESSRLKSLEVLNALRGSALTKSTSTFSDIFEKQAKMNLRVALCWLGVAVFAVIGILVFVYHFFIDSHQALATALKSLSQSAVPQAKETSLGGFPFQAVIIVTLSKFLFVSLATAFLFQIIKNYNSNMHLHTLNKHKANCLSILKLLQESSDEKGSREIVLMQATKAIFELNETGFISSKEKEITGLESVRILEQGKGGQ